jgi:hypothetical protein
MQASQSHPREIIGLWKSVNPRAHVSAFAQDIEVETLTAHAWIRRGKIPSRYWTRIISAANARSFPITYTSLAGETPIPQQQERAA